jgi:hypothetical protein
MSRYVYLHCTDHKESSDSLNHGEELLRDMWRTAPQVKALCDAGAWDSSLRPWNGEHGDWFRWIAEHAGCAVILRDEYGGVGAATDSTERCQRTDMDEQHVATWTGRRIRTLEEVGV